MRAVPAHNPHHAALCRSAAPFGAASPSARHCKTRAAQDIKIHHGPTFDRPTCCLRSRYRQTTFLVYLHRLKVGVELPAWVSPIHGLNPRITPSASGGHDNPKHNRRRQPAPRLTRTVALVSFRALNRIKPQLPVHV